MLIIPAIDLRQGQCVRLAQGRRADVKIYGDDAVEVARNFEAQGARMLHVVNLDGAFDESDSLNREVARQIMRAVQIPVQLGGGLRSERAIEQLIEAGASRVVVGTLAVESPATLENLVRRFGSSIAVGIDARDGLVKTRGWEREGNLSAIELARRVAGVGVERIIYTDIARDGMLDGLNIAQTCAIAHESGLRVTASGGVSSLEDIERLAEAGSVSGIDSVIVGRAIYEGRFTLDEALQLTHRSSSNETHDC
ncbi:MAG: phosphoribosylformimino-5-aminoimidazole carboxamide ribotide isomerase [Acidobacteriota bacterium]|nr:phosphoribosylformimino-5-aminoimidazole carboxamide ribotide isomerase [Acidobacteriota bacterium]